MKISQKSVIGKLAVLALAATIAGVGVGPAQATYPITIAADAFTAADGTPLAGRSTPVGNLPWQAVPNWTSTIMNNAVYSAMDRDGVLVNPASYNSGLDLQVSLNPVAAGGGYTIGFYDSNWTQEVWVNIASVLTMQVYANGSGGYTWYLDNGATQIPGATGDWGSDNAFKSVELAYDEGLHQATLTIGNGTPNVYNDVLINWSGIEMAGFSGYGAFTPAADFADFELTGNIPEPSTIFLLGIGAALLWLRQRAQR